MEQLLWNTKYSMKIRQGLFSICVCMCMFALVCADASVCRYTCTMCMCVCVYACRWRPVCVCLQVGARENPWLLFLGSCWPYCLRWISHWPGTHEAGCIGGSGLLLPSPPQCWDDKCALQFLAIFF